MQRHCVELTDRLLRSLDPEYNVVDMAVVLEVITMLERTSITKEVLEITRLGKYVNELRRKTSDDALARRAKDLVRRWREMVLPQPTLPAEPVLATAPPLNGTRGLRPQSPPAALLPSKPPSESEPPTEAVPRTHSANKRLRKESAVEPEKRARLNGETTTGCATGNPQVPSPTLKERNPELVEPQSEIHIAKKRGRKKGSKSVKKQLSAEDSVKEKLASISRNPKLKTTQELLADLQARGSKPSPVGLLPSHSIVGPPSVELVLRSKGDRELRPTRSKDCSRPEEKLEPEERCRESDTVDEDTLDSETPAEPEGRKALSVEEILAKLPPLDRNSIDWSELESEHEENRVSEKLPEVTEEDVERLHSQCIEGLNGNFQPKFEPLSGDSAKTKICTDKVNFSSVIGLHRPLDSHKDKIFREWHEMLARPSCDGQILHILPYVIID